MRTLPLRGWHAQQLRRIAIAEKITEDALFYCDSDVAFLKPFDCASLWRGEDLRLFRRDNELLGELPGDQQLWADNAAMLLGIKGAPVLPHGYVGTLVAWRRDRFAWHVPQDRGSHLQTLAAGHRPPPALFRMHDLRPFRR